jgi:hypothetical protein
LQLSRFMQNNPPTRANVVTPEAQMTLHVLTKRAETVPKTTNLLNEKSHVYSKNRFKFKL